MFFVNKYILFIITIFLTQCNNNDSQNTQDKLEQVKKDQLNDNKFFSCKLIFRHQL